jgi:hypothetical protein
LPDRFRSCGTLAVIGKLDALSAHTGPNKRVFDDAAASIK